MTTGTGQAALSGSCRLYGSWQNKNIYLVTLKNDAVELHMTNIGCAVTAICIPDKNGQRKSIVAGFEQLENYLHNPHYLGSVVGRYVNRISNGRFILDGKTIQLSVNEQGNHLHGGTSGFHEKIWEMGELKTADKEISISFEYFSADGEEGYPGNLQVRVTYTLTSQNCFCMEYVAVTDKTTPVNLSSHTYFNLSGFENPVVNDHLLQVYADSYTEKNERNLPTGRLLSLRNTPLDFLVPEKIGRHIGCFSADGGFDHNYVLQRTMPKALKTAAELYDPLSGRWVKISTTEPGLQVYTANWWDGSLTGVQQVPYVKHGAVALETQAFPDSPNHPAFPSTLLVPGHTYLATTIFEFGVKAHTPMSGIKER